MMPNWKPPRKDGLHRYWLKNLTSWHPHITAATRLDDLLKDSTAPKRPGKGQ